MRTTSLVCLMVLFSACARSADSAGKAEKTTTAAAPQGFGHSPLKPVAQEVIGLADAAIAGQTAPATFFPLNVPKPTISFGEAPSGKIKWILFFAETGVLVEKQGGGYARFKFGLVQGPQGLRLSEARARAETELSKEISPLPVPAPVEAAVQAIFGAARQGKFAELKISGADFAGTGSSRVTARLVEDSDRFDVSTQELAKLAGKIIQIELDDIGLIGVDESGVVFMAAADLDRAEKGFAFDKDEGGIVFSAAAVPVLEEKAWQADLATICALAEKVDAEPSADKMVAFQERLQGTKVSAVARQLFGAWSRSPKALSRAHAQRLLEDAGGPKNWNCPALVKIWSWQP